MIGRKAVLALALAASALWGCATQEKYEQAVRLWIGEREETLIAGWGIPHGFYESGGARYLTYRQVNRMHIPGMPPTYYANTIAGQTRITAVGGSEPYTRIMTCETTFLVRNGTVRSFTSNGDHCVSQ
jgi:hypothetical protein